jgi:hypothetical protein
MVKVTQYQYSILEIVSLGHGNITLHGVSVVAGIGNGSDETSLPTLRNLEKLGLVDQTLPGRSDSKWRVTELGHQVLAAGRPDSAQNEGSEAAE